MFAYCLNNSVRYKDTQGYIVTDCYDEADDPDNPFDDLETTGGGHDSLGVSSYYASGAAWHSNGGSGTGSMIGDMAYQQTKAANTTSTPQYSWGDLGGLPSGNTSSQCFVAGTRIQTADGTTPIEEIQVGDLVWAWNEETGEVALKEVVETYINETDELVHIHVNGEEIICTPSHPFYSPVKGWTDAVHLRAGDILVLLNGDYVIVEKVQHEILESPVTVYNFQVADYHTYYVSTGVLVHNVCGMNNKDATVAAKKLGYSKVKNTSSHGNAVFSNPKAPRALRYITADADMHSGGVWKAADTIANLGSKATRSGTYDELLRWIAP